MRGILLVVLPLLVTVAACSSCAPSDGGAPGPADAAPTPDAPPVNLDPERLMADIEDCPEGYVEAAPAAGVNANFLVAGQQRSFVLIMPPASFTGPRPLFVGFNGTSENGTKFANRADLADFAAAGFIVLAPSSVGNGMFWPIWDGMRPPGGEGGANKDLAYFDALVGCVAAHYEVDKKRIYVGGHSAGGIFTNKVLRARSSLVAGAIVGSGVFDLTGDGTDATPSPLLAIVTWGGDNDRYAGTTPGGITVPDFTFVEQAARASQYYAGAPGLTQVACRGDDLGHAWLPINAWFIEALLSHPKGAPAGTALPSLPAGGAVTCSQAAYEVAPLPSVACGSSSVAGCQAACQLMADCVVENHTVGTVMKDQWLDLGFTSTTCGGCIAQCGQVAATNANAEVLACFAQAESSAQCGPGIEGALPFMAAVNDCCDGREDASFCVSICAEFNSNEAASGFFPVCAAFAP